MCAVAVCERPPVSRGWCSLHYQRWKKYGDPERTPEVSVRTGYSREEILRSKYEVDFETGCWLWKGRLDKDGYGVGSWDRKPVRAHRWAYETLVGPIPEGLTLDHVQARGCRHRHCVNPDHLEPVTSGENVLRGDTLAARNAAKTRCDDGHAFTPENTYIYENGERECRTCKRIAARVRRDRKKGASA